jgi:hypothetical protein
MGHTENGYVAGEVCACKTGKCSGKTHNLYVFGTSREWIEYLRAAFQGHSLVHNAHHRQLAGTRHILSPHSPAHSPTATLIAHNEGLKGRANTHPSLRRVSDAMIAKSSPLTPSTVLRKRVGCAQQSCVSECVSQCAQLTPTHSPLTHTHTYTHSLSHTHTLCSGHACGIG